MTFSFDPYETRRCDHCLKINEFWELEKLKLQKCSILQKDETYLLCEYCIGAIEAMGEGVEEVQYWNEWVSNKRLEKDK
ncbi:hypothetical protein [Brevibacillus sp. SIMBA_040]|uniref:hypothetical protein n=1 Tax=unclassified Brevibacillus TaxID=2684853 RepID=UPI00397B7B15